MIQWKFNLGDSISGDRICAWAGRIFQKRDKKKDSKILRTFDLKENAGCIVEVPLKIQSNIKAGSIEGLRGKKIYSEAENFSRIKKSANKRTGRHTYLEMKLHDSVYCVIELPIRSRQILS